MKFSTLSAAFEKLERTASRNTITEILAELFRKTPPAEIDIICYLSLGRLVPLYESLEFQLAEKMVIRVIAQAFDVREDIVRRSYKRIGDLGEVAEKFKVPRQRTGKQSAKFKVKKLTVAQVYEKLRRIAEERGEGSQQRKVTGLAELLVELSPLSARYVVRMVLGRLRLGFSDTTLLDALSWMEQGDKGLRSQIEKAYFVHADIGVIARKFKKEGIEGLSGISVDPGVPIMPALCQRLKSADEMVKKMKKVAVEPKYDGQRVQIHYRKLKAQSSKRKSDQWQIRAFTRNLEEVSHMFPELTKIAEQIEAEEVVLDSEAVGFDVSSGKILPFQQIITRKRKHAVLEASKKVPLRFFVFDILYKDGRSLLSLPLSQRALILNRTIRGGSVLVMTQRLVTDRASELRAYHLRQLEEGLEGAVVKKWNDRYIPGRRGWSWVKFKEAEEKAAGLADTLDCVVMGYYRGRGKRASFGIGGFLVGVRQGGKFLTVSKIGTGLTDEQWRELRKRADTTASKERPKAYEKVEKRLIPDVWTGPTIVVEIAADNITKSPMHAAGLALRFPRLVRFRDDKSPSQVTTISELQQLHRLGK